jgi:hypothetical protein
VCQNFDLIHLVKEHGNETSDSKKKKWAFFTCVNRKEQNGTLLESKNKQK